MCFCCYAGPPWHLTASHPAKNQQFHISSAPHHKFGRGMLTSLSWLMLHAPDKRHRSTPKLFSLFSHQVCHAIVSLRTLSARLTAGCLWSQVLSATLPSVKHGSTNTQTYHRLWAKETWQIHKSYWKTRDFRVHCSYLRHKLCERKRKLLLEPNQHPKYMTSILFGK